MGREKTYVQDDYYEQMRAITRYYDEIDEKIILLRSRMHAILHLSFPELEQLITPSSAIFLNIVQLYPHPALLIAHSKTIIKNRLKSNTRKNLSLERAEKKAIVLLEVVGNSYPAVAMSEGRKEYPVLRSFPSIGDTTVCRLIGELGDIRRFKNAKQLNAYVGIDIMRYQSGNTHYRDRINKT